MAQLDFGRPPGSAFGIDWINPAFYATSPHTVPPQSGSFTLINQNWNGLSAYSNNTYVIYNGAVYISFSNIAAPTPQTTTTYTTINTWNAGSTTGLSYVRSGNDYWFNANPYPANQYFNTNVRIQRFSGGVGGTVIASLEGTLTTAPGFRNFRVGSASQMSAAFGISNIGTNVSAWRLSQVTTSTTTTPNTVPSSSHQWGAASTFAWDAYRGYNVGLVVSYNSNFYRTTSHLNYVDNASRLAYNTNTNSFQWVRKNNLTSNTRPFAFDDVPDTLIWRQP